MSEILVCPVCGKEYKSKFHYDKHVEAHGEHEVTWTPEGIPEIEKMVADVPEPEPVLIPTSMVGDIDPEKAKVMVQDALTKFDSFARVVGIPSGTMREKWDEAIGALKAAIDHL